VSNGVARRRKTTPRLPPSSSKAFLGDWARSYSTAADGASVLVGMNEEITELKLL